MRVLRALLLACCAALLLAPVVAAPTGHDAAAPVAARGGAEAWTSERRDPAPSGRSGTCQKPKKKADAKKKRKKKKGAAPDETPEVTAPPEPSAEPSPTPEPSPVAAPAPPPDEVPAATAPSVVPAGLADPAAAQPVSTSSGLRKASAVTPGSLSRWSNAGAMEPIVTEVELTAPLPARAVPLLPGQATPGQRLTAEDERLSAHLSLFGEHSQTVRQDAEDLNLIRGRATIDYERIAKSEFGLHLDLEYRGTAGARRLTDRKINALYLSWGATDFRRDDGPAFGVALGRVAVREAGYAQVDGALLRYRVVPELKLGVYGGLTGNPYNYNWRLAATEDFSTGWVGGGLFGSMRLGPVSADLAAGLVLATFPGGGLDRLYLYADVGWAVSDALDLYFTGWFDLLPNGTAIQNVELLGSYHPSRDLHLRLSAARYASLIYAFATNYSFRFDPRGNTIAPDLTIVDEAGVPIDPYDARSLQSVYDELGARLGYRVVDELEPFVALTIQIRESAGEGAVEFAGFRLLPSVGVTYRDPAILDVSAQVVGIVDAQTERKAVLQLAVGRELAGLRVGGDLRGFVGGQGAVDGGLDLTYTLSRELVPGRLLLRAMLRYVREDVVIARPTERCLADTEAAGCGSLLPDQALPLVPLQETVYGFAGVDWRY